MGWGTKLLAAVGIAAGSYYIVKAANQGIDEYAGSAPPPPRSNVPDQTKAWQIPGAFLESGIASWYGPGYVGNPTANGEKFDPTQMTAAHKTLPFGLKVKVLDNETGKSVVVRINDRGPYVTGRIIDLSQGAAEALGTKIKGLANVSLYVHDAGQVRNA